MPLLSNILRAGYGAVGGAMSGWGQGLAVQSAGMGAKRALRSGLMGAGARGLGKIGGLATGISAGGPGAMWGATGGILGAGYGALSDDTSMLGGALKGAALFSGGYGLGALGRGARGAYRTARAVGGGGIGRGQAAWMGALHAGGMSKRFFGSQYNNAVNSFKGLGYRV